MKVGINDVRTSDYRGKVKLRESAKAEVLRIREERAVEKAQRNERNSLRDTDTFASCSCGWSCFGTDAIRVAQAAQTHSLMHFPSQVTPRDRTGLIALQYA